MCWRGGKYAKREMEVESRIVKMDRVAVPMLDDHSFRKQPLSHHQHQVHKPPRRTVIRPSPTKRKFSSSSGYTTESKSTQASANTPSSHTRPVQGHHGHVTHIPPMHVHRSQLPNAPEKKRLPRRHPSKQRHAQAPNAVPRRATSSPKKVYIAVKRDLGTITEFPVPDMDVDDEEDDYDSRMSNSSAQSSFDLRYGRSLDDMSGTNMFMSYQPDGFLEATILRSDSYSTKDMSVIGAEAHVSVYNLSQRMSYDIREAGRNLSSIATKVAFACAPSPKMIKY